MNKKQMEDDITKAMITWEKVYKGRGPTEAKTDILRNMVIVYLKGVMSPAERQLATTKEGAELVKKVREQLVEQSRPQFDEIIQRITSAIIISMHTDISVKSGDRVFVFVIDREL